MYRRFFLTALLTSLLWSGTVMAQPFTGRQADSLVEQTLRTFNVPGIALGIVKDGKLIHAKGYGVRSLKSGKKVDENTLFGVASNTKAFTAAALGILIDSGKITWDTRVTDIIPEFKLYDPYVTNEFTVRDLLTHRSGLGLGAGDLMIWPDSSTVTKKQMIHNLRYLKPVSSFRTKYDYDNLLYIVAGEVVARISGISYEDFIESRIIRPLGMTATAASWYRLKDRSNIIDGHAPSDGKLVPVGLSFTELANAAGGMYSNVTDMSKWVIAQMNGGQYGQDNKKRLFSAAVHREMWSPQTIINGGSPYNTHFSAYGLGWFLSDVNGYLQVSHTGGLAGIVTQVTMVPELRLGIIVLTNQQSGAAFTAITNTIKDAYFGIKGKDRIKQYNDARLKNEKEAADIVGKVQAQIASAGAGSPDPAAYAGTFSDPWFGQATISVKQGHLYFQSRNSPKLRGDMYFYKANTWLVKWQDRSLDADAFVTYQLDSEGRPTGFKMEAISPLTDFSFDFQDLDFKLNTKQ
ncbi:serine hydrolase [Pedobacter yulinensis]|uniref:Serine hydrolase n=1 Tax=Pedobacter yulinensis TaxID=2126353 RepID=A0A2T3HQK4_9SPHI|nr:serine hydrolase [Pedobacter yulinensis]PST84728.1 serine hydrolase [Pedobacter yulinensis]